MDNTREKQNEKFVGFNLRFTDKDLHKRLKLLAVYEDCSMHDLVIEGIKRVIADRESKGKNIKTNLDRAA